MLGPSGGVIPLDACAKPLQPVPEAADVGITLTPVPKDAFRYQVLDSRLPGVT